MINEVYSSLFSTTRSLHGRYKKLIRSQRITAAEKAAAKANAKAAVALYTEQTQTLKSDLGDADTELKVRVMYMCCYPPCIASLCCAATITHCC